MKHSINVQAICDEKGIFLDVDASWHGLTHDGNVFKNSIINKMFLDKSFPGSSRTLVSGRDSVPPLLIGDPAYPLQPNVMKEFTVSALAHQLAESESVFFVNPEFHEVLQKHISNSNKTHSGDLSMFN